MKKILTVLALALAMATAAHAQIGIVGGYTASSTGLSAKDYLNVKNMSQFHAGIAYKLDLGPFFTLQPSLTYEAKGMNVNEVVAGGSVNTSTLKNTSGFVELGVGAQVGVDLLAFRPFLLVQPFVGLQVYDKQNYTLAGADMDSINEALATAKNKLEYGFGVGGGVELVNHVQISVQWFMNLGSLYDNGKLTNIQGAVLTNYKDIKNYQGVKVSLALFF